MRAFLVLLFVCASFGAHAATVTGTVTGAVTSADPGNAFGLDVTDTITLTVVYDDDAITGSGTETVFFNPTTGNTMDFTVGGFSFSEDMDTAGGVGPNIVLVDGALSEISYDTQFGTSGLFFSFLGFFQGSDDDIRAINGEWNVGGFSTATVVPVPFALALMGSALGVLGVVRASRSTSSRIRPEESPRGLH